MAYREGVYYVDGAVSKKPEDSEGPARCSFFNLESETKVIEKLGLQTINFSEYLGLIMALSDAIRNKYKAIKIYTDSQLIYQQITGEWEVRAENLKGLFSITKNLLSYFEVWEIVKIKSEENKADLK